MRKQNSMLSALSFLSIFILPQFGNAYASPAGLSEFHDESVVNYLTAGQPKSKGLNMQISYPKSWKAMDSDRPNIVKKFVSNDGRGLEMAMIITKSIPLPQQVALTTEQMKDYFGQSKLKEYVPEGYDFIESKPTSIDGIPGGIVEYSMRQERAGRTVIVQSISYMFIQGHTFVAVQFSVGASPASSTELRKRMADFKSLTFLMANSITLLDQFK